MKYHQTGHRVLSNNINCQMSRLYFSKCYSNVYPHFFDTEGQPNNRKKAAKAAQGQQRKLHLHHERLKGF